MTREDYKKELELFPHTIKVGEKGTGYTKKIQEWICLHKFHTPRFWVNITIDDDYGKATASAVKTFQEIKGLIANGEVDNETWQALTAPMMRAFRPIHFDVTNSIQDRLIAFMYQFIVEHPTELGNANKGPWVRAFMKGKEGDWAAWCNGVVSTALDLAASSMGKDMSEFLPWSWSTQETKKNAKKDTNSATYIEAKNLKASDIAVGDLFVVVNKKGTPRHIGVVARVNDDVYSCYEGNTNDEGSREGYELCERRRKLLNGNYSIIKLT